MPKDPDLVRLTFQLDVAYCSECPFHAIVPNPDPHDTFSKENALLCQKLPNDQQGLSARPASRSPYRVILERGRNLDRQPVPSWCPLREPNNIPWTRTRILSVRRSTKPLLPFEELMTELGIGWSRCLRSLDLLPFKEPQHARMVSQDPERVRALVLEYRLVLLEEKLIAPPVVAFLDLLVLALQEHGTKEGIRTWFLRPDRALGGEPPLDAYKLRMKDVQALLKKKEGPSPGAASDLPEPTPND